MHCPRCSGSMILMELIIRPRSTQTWYQCTTCNRLRLLSTDRPRFFVGSGQNLRSRFWAPTAIARE
jgi:hypothetical protein